MLGEGGLIVAAVGLVLSIIGVAIPYWYYYSEVEDGVKASLYFGLWKLCIRAEGFGQAGTGCRKFDEFNIRLLLPSEMDTARGLELTGIVLLATAILVAGLKVVWKKGDDRNLKVGGGIACAAGLLMLAGAIAFSSSDELKKLIDIPTFDIPFKLHAGFALCVVAGVLSLAAALMLLLEKNEIHRTVSQQYPHIVQHGGNHAVITNPPAMAVIVQQPSVVQTF